MSIPKISPGGQMSGSHFQLGGKCPFILFFIGGQISWGANIQELDHLILWIRGVYQYISLHKPIFLRLTKLLRMSTHNIHFCREIRNIHMYLLETPSYNKLCMYLQFWLWGTCKVLMSTLNQTLGRCSAIFKREITVISWLFCTSSPS